MMTALLFALSVALQAPNSVTYTAEAKPVGVVLQEVSKASGLHLKADPEASREIVLVSVKDMPTQAFLDRLARATSCRWDRDGDEEILKPDDAQRSREADAEADARTKAIAKQIEQFAKGGTAGAFTATVQATSGTVSVSSSADSKSKDAQDQPKPPVDPGEKALGQILSQMDPAEVAAIRSGEREVWATNSPTSTQKLLPGGSAELISEWIQKHNEAVSKNKETNPQADQILQALPKELVEQFKRESQPVTKTPTKALLAIKRSALLGSVLGLQVTLTAYDAQGEPLIDTQTMLASGLQALIQQYQPKPKAATSQPEKKTPIAYSDDSKALIALIGEGAQGMSMRGVPTALRAKLQHPDLRDPLAYVATDQLMALAKSDGAQLIADLPDKSFGFGNGIDVRKAAANVEDVQKDLDSGQTIKGAVEDGCLTISPAEPAENRRGQVDRSALATLLSAAISKRQPSLDDMCGYALANDPPFANSIALVYCQFFAPGLVGTGMTAGPADWNMLRFYGVLSQVQRQTLRAGGRVSLFELNDSQRSYAAAVLFGADEQFRSGSEAGSKDVVSRMILMFSGGGGNGGLDPTELMPNGLPGSGYLTCAVTDEPIIQALETDGKSNAAAFSATDLALLDLVQGFPGASAIANYLPSKGLLGHRTNLDFVFHVGGGSMDQTLVDAFVPEDAQEVSLKSLPPDLQALVDKQKADLKKSPLGMIAALPMFHQAPPP